MLLYVSLVDIFATETLGHFTSAGNSNAQATAFATLCFFGGMPIAYGECIKGAEHSNPWQWHVVILSAVYTDMSDMSDYHGRQLVYTVSTAVAGAQSSQMGIR